MADKQYYKNYREGKTQVMLETESYKFLQAEVKSFGILTSDLISFAVAKMNRDKEMRNGLIKEFLSA